MNKFIEKLLIILMIVFATLTMSNDLILTSAKINDENDYYFVTVEDAFGAINMIGAPIYTYDYINADYHRVTCQQCEISFLESHNWIILNQSGNRAVIDPIVWVCSDCGASIV